MNRRFALAALPALGIALSGCTLNPVSPAQVAALEEAVTIAEVLALNYTKLPPCPQASGLCSDPATKTSVKAKGQTAHDAVLRLKASSASGAPAALSAAQEALVQLQAAVPGVAK